MKLSELIAIVGDENVRFQNLDQSTENMQYNIKKGITISFLTKEKMTSDMLGMECLGLVVWLPRDLVKKAMEE